MYAKPIRRAFATAAFGVALFTVGQAGYAAKLIVIPTLTCPLGCGGVVNDVELSNAMARHHLKIALAPQETPGFMYNIRYMDKTYNSPKTKRTIFGTEDAVLELGPEGGRGIIKASLPDPIRHHFKLLFAQAANAQGRFFLTFDPKIKTIADMKGKRVDLGLLTQSDWGLSGRMVLNAYGINSRNTNIRYVTPAVMTSQLIDGTVDAATSGILGNPTASNKWTPTRPLLKLIAAAKASGRKLYYLSIDPKIIHAINEKYATTYFTVTLQPHTLPLQDKRFTMGLVRSYHAGTVDFPPHIAYQITKAVLTYGDELRKEGGAWHTWSAKGMVAGLTQCNTNLGSIKAYKEFKVWQYRTKGGPPAKIPGC